MIEKHRIPPQQLEFPSLAFGSDRTVLYVHEVAKKWRVTKQHVLNLLEEGKLNGFDIAGRHEYIRVPASAIEQLAKMFGIDKQTILKVIRDAKPSRRSGRVHWRIPVKEGYDAFMKENHSLSGETKLH